MTRATSFQHGIPSWVDLSTTDQSAAKSFYGALFGWEFEDHPMGPEMMYSLALKDGAAAAVIFTRHGQEEEMGIPPHWNVYISVDDVDATAAKVVDAGGNLIAGPFDVPQPGRMCVVQDPTGGFVQLWQPGEATLTRVREEHGALCWAELATTDQTRAIAFFKELLSAGTESTPMPDGSTYHMITANGMPAAGIWSMNQEMLDQGIPTHWEPYFRVDDAHAVAENAKSLGARVLFEPETIDMAGTIAVFMDPQGAAFGIQQP